MNLLVAILLDAFADDSEEVKEKNKRDSLNGSEMITPPSSYRQLTNRSEGASNPATEREVEVEPSEIRWPRDYSLLIFSPRYVHTPDLPDLHAIQLVSRRGSRCIPMYPLTD